MESVQKRYIILLLSLIIPCFIVFVVQQALSNDTQTSPPLTITLFTYDASLLCDASMEDHKFALTRFWNRIRPHFHKNQLATIDIVLFHTGTVVAVGQQEHPPKQEIKTVDNKIADGIELSSEDESTKLKTANDAVSSLRRNLVDLAEADYKTDRNREHPVTPVSISVLLVERDESFGKISRRWTKRILSPPNLTRSISFALPEMSDGTQCSIFLDLSFRLLPYPIDVARGLLEDLRLLSSSIIEVIQVCPLSTVDANLLFGVAMEAIPGFQREEDRYREMKALVYVLFKKLRLKDIALLLRATPMHNVSSPSSSYGSPLHHTHHQTYLLSAEDFPATTQKSLSQVAIEGNPPLPVRGSLYRYGNADQMVIVGGGELYTPEVDTETLDQLNDYIEASIDFFPNSDINPLVNEGERMLINEVKHMKLVREVTNADKIFDESEKWSDKTGIGSTVALHRDFKDSTSSADNATSKRSANVDVATSNAAYEEKAAWNDGSSIASTMVEEKGDLSVVPARSLKFQQPSPTKNTAKKNGEQRAPIEEESNEKDESMDFETLSEQSFKENENLISSAVSAPEDFLKGPVNTARKGKVEANNQSFYCGELPSPHSYSSYGSLDDITKIVANALKRQKQSAIDCGTAAVSVAEKEEDQLELSEKTSNEVSSKEERTTENIVTSRKEGILKTNLKSLPQRKDVTVDACLFDTDEEPSKQIILYRACDEESVISDPITPCKTGNDNEAVSGNPASPHKEAKIEDATQHKYSSKHINHDNSSTDGNDKNYKENGKSNERGNGTFDYYGADSDDDWRGYRGVGFKGQKKETAKNDDSGGASGSNSESEPFVQMKARKSKLRIKYKGREEKEMSDKSVVCTENDEESTVKYASEDTSIERKEESKTKDRKLIVKSQKVEESSDDSDTSGEFGVYQKRKHKQSKLHAEVKAILEDSDIGSDF